MKSLGISAPSCPRGRPAEILLTNPSRPPSTAATKRLNVQLPLRYVRRRAAMQTSRADAFFKPPAIQSVPDLDLLSWMLDEPPYPKDKPVGLPDHAGPLQVASSARQKYVPASIANVLTHANYIALH